MLFVASKRNRPRRCVRWVPCDRCCYRWFRSPFFGSTRFEATKTPTIHLILPVIPDCINELQWISTGWLEWWWIEHVGIYSFVKYTASSQTDCRKKLKYMIFGFQGSSSIRFQRKYNFPRSRQEKSVQASWKATARILARSCLQHESSGSSHYGPQSVPQKVL